MQPNKPAALDRKSRGGCIFCGIISFNFSLAEAKSLLRPLSRGVMNPDNLQEEFNLNFYKYLFYDQFSRSKLPEYHLVFRIQYDNLQHGFYEKDYSPSFSSPPDSEDLQQGYLFFRQFVFGLVWVFFEEPSQQFF